MLLPSTRIRVLYRDYARRGSNVFRECFDSMNERRALSNETRTHRCVARFRVSAAFVS